MTPCGNALFDAVFDAVFGLRVRGRLPLHVCGCIGAAALQRHDVIDDVAWASAPGLAGCWTRVLPLEFPSGGDAALDLCGAPCGTMLLQGVHMRRLLTLILALMFFGVGSAVVPAQQPAPQQQPQTKEQIVYITKTGKKYHRAGCRYLSQSKISTTLKDAKANGYTACSVCRPPQ